MFLRYLLLFAVGLSVHSVKGQNKVRWHSWDVANEKIVKNDKKYFIYLYFDGCKWCKHMENNTFHSDAIAKFINQNYYAFKLNAESSDKIVIGEKSFTTVRIGKYDFNELASELTSGHMSFPSIVILDENFKKIGIHDGYIDNEKFEMLLSYYTGNYHKTTIWRKFATSYCKDHHFNTLAHDKN